MYEALEGVKHRNMTLRVITLRSWVSKLRHNNRKQLTTFLYTWFAIITVRGAIMPYRHNDCNYGRIVSANNVKSKEKRVKCDFSYNSNVELI